MSSKYVLGQVASALSGNKKTGHNVNAKLISLFSAPPKKRKAAPTLDVASSSKDAEPAQKKKKKRKQDDDDDAVAAPSVPSSSSSSAGFCPPPGIVHEALSQQQSTSPDKVGKKRKLEAEDENAENQPTKRKPRHRRDKSKDPRTVFVGNLPLDSTKKTVKKLFKQFGDIENLRFRCPPVAEQGMRKRESMTTKKFHPKRDNIVCYVCFKEEESAQKAVSMNGHLLNEHHLRVDLSTDSKKHDNKLSVFVGNLPFDIKEDTLREFFQACGDVTNVRVVRDSATSIGKGFAYVAFESRDDVENALRLNGQKVQGRPARVSRCHNKPKVKKTAEAAEKEESKTGKGFRKPGKSPGRPGKSPGKPNKPFLKKKDKKAKDMTGKKVFKKGRREDDKEPRKKKVKFLPTNMAGTSSSFSGKLLAADKREKRMRKKQKLRQRKAEEGGAPGMAPRRQNSKKFKRGPTNRPGGKVQKRRKFGGGQKNKQGSKKFKNKG